EVTAELLERRLERAGLRWARAEVWQEPIPLLVLLGAGPADVTPGGTAVLLRSLVREAILYFEPGEVADARRALASRWLLESRTPEGLAGRIAEQLARSGTAEGVLEYGAALARVELGAVANLLAELELAIPLAVELSP
ncbi:MAG: hypothetical protein HY561_09990, partial [Gemmatimonadetes bacterium]|nr:hypothetical protein [Gemmatimonadota bacterium]